MGGTPQITAKRFELQATLGLSLGVFKAKNEAAIVGKLDTYLVEDDGRAWRSIIKEKAI